MKGRIVHLTSVHSSSDPRIFVKECTSLAQRGYEVFYIVPTNETPERGIVNIVPLKKHKSRLLRMLLTPFSLLGRGLKLKADLYHMHDPELLPLGLILKLFGKKVVFDSHENVRQQILNKYYLPKWIRKFISSFYAFLEDFAVGCFDGVITVVPSIASMFPPEKTSIVANYPLLEEIEKMKNFGSGERKAHLLFSGALTHERGALQLLKTMELLQTREDVTLQLAGTIKPETLQTELEKMPGWKKVVFHGWVGREKILELLKDCSIGIVTYLPSPNYYDMSINKLYEYMAASMPIIASDIPLWREKLGGIGCCLFVNPEDTKAIAAAVEHLLEHREEAAAMGEQGRKAVMERFNWGVSEEVLLQRYERILSKNED